MKWIISPAQKINDESVLLAKAHQSVLTKPAGSLGRLEDIAEQFAGWQGVKNPLLNNIQVVVFAGDHGVCQQQVSAFPQEVTMQMIVNFLQGGAAISVLSHQMDADFNVVNMGIVTPLPDPFVNHQRLINKNICSGTADLSQQSAMSEEQCLAALDAGKSLLDTSTAQLFIGGEMGIGNTTSASAIYAALLSLSAAEVVGPGTGVDAAGLLRKQEVINTALELHKDYLSDPYQALRRLGGLEIAALVGSYIASAQKGIPVLVDGFICTAAALLAVRINPSVKEWLLYSHRSAEPAHCKALDALDASPLLDLGLRLGEGSGAALTVSLLQSALCLHNNMATFTQAGVSEGE